ncbi:Alpha/Beta hydrolase protein [Dactylonectria macrodidyma]|uniref:Alpha/Beta hydrolase protein n=1 Tax=Dactylonectria macrodidyma TaxID=307937 RepID=A0A9P9FFT2_9HYPO|nr:Alpha/Beta hydrolase protein [Dactylonectria macrodidyma]
MKLSVVRQRGLAIISPEWTEFAKHVPIPPLIGTPEELRQMKFPQDDSPPVGFSIKQIPVLGYEGWTNEIRIYAPDVQCAARAVIVYVHGGGWTVGDLDSEDAACRTMCKSTGTVVVSVDYRKAPENAFPIGLEDVWAGVLWVFDNIESLGGDQKRVILGGLSAGGNIAAVLAQRARDTNRVSFCGQILRIPFVVHPKAQPASLDFSSYDENANAPILPSASVTQFLDYYNAPPEDIRVSPLLAADLSELPRTFIQIAGADPLRDDGFAYAEKLEQAGVPVKVSVYPGLPHGFMMLPLATSVQSNQDLTEAIKWMISE